jgi:hypothetical protein
VSVNVVVDLVNFSLGSRTVGAIENIFFWAPDVTGLTDCLKELVERREHN